MEALIPIIIQAVSGMVGGGIAGTLLKQAAMQMLPNCSPAVWAALAAAWRWGRSSPA